MTGEGTNKVWTVVDELKKVVSERLNEVEGFELDEHATEVLVDTLARERIFNLEEVKDLNGFSHFASENSPHFSLLIDSKLIYLYQHRQVRRSHGDMYYRYLSANDVCSLDYSYEQFLSDNPYLNGSEEEVVYYTSDVFKAGDVLFKSITNKQRLRKQLEQAESNIHKLQDLLGQEYSNVFKM